jgi:MmeI, target recognition domain
MQCSRGQMTSYHRFRFTGPTSEEKEAFLKLEPEAVPLMHPYVGSREFINGGDRWILCFKGVPPEVLKRIPKVRERISNVREYRLKSTSKPIQELASTPLLYHVNVVPERPFLVIPEVSSERREYVPIGWMEPPTIPSNLLYVLNDATKSLFAILTSSMHMTWLRYIGGRLKSDYRYSIGLVYLHFGHFE